MNIKDKIRSELKKSADPEKAKVLRRFFKTGKGEYGEGDKFIGVDAPKMRSVTKKYFCHISIEETSEFLKENGCHEERMAALIILMLKYQNGTEAEKKKIFNLYLKNTKFINNWDLVDVTCRDIVGAYLLEKSRKKLYKLAKSKDIWERRIAIVSTFYFIQRKDLDDTFKIAEILLSDKHDLIHKAVGWMLREAGKRDKERLTKFLDENFSKMPRTMFRYAIEKFSPKERKYFLNKK